MNNKKRFKSVLLIKTCELFDLNLNLYNSNLYLKISNLRDFKHDLYILKIL